MKISTLTVGPLQENCHLLVEGGEAVLIDPGDEAARLLAAVDAAGATLVAIWMTHAHFDHLGALAEIRRHVPDAPIHLHPADRPLYDRAAQSAGVYGLSLESPPAPDRELADGDELTLGSLRFRVLHAPGHAPGHVVFHGEGVAFVGDCLFAGSVGRTDLPFADARALAATLERLAALPDDTQVYSGHGPATTIGVERRSNPFLNGTLRLVGA